MEQYPVRKIEKPIDWCVTVPGSKEHDKPGAFNGSTLGWDSDIRRRAFFR